MHDSPVSMGRALDRDRRGRPQRQSCSVSDKCRVLGNAIRPGAFVAFDEEVIELGLSARAADAA